MEGHMGPLTEELGLGINPTIVPKMISDMVKEVSMIDDLEAKVSMLDTFVNWLADEMNKIVRFKQELPFCMLLLNDATEHLKDEAKKYKQPAAEEFLPMKRKKSDGDDDEGDSSLNQKDKDFNEKKNWFTSFHLWDINKFPSYDSNACDQTQTVLIEYKTNMGAPVNSCVNEVMNKACKSRNEPNGFLNFKAQHGLTRKEEMDAFPNPGIKYSRVVEEEEEKSETTIFKSTHKQRQPAKKQRRSWSPELQSRFINALEQLGGCNAATPKQIRELMQVDGLTNDQVKSHLQKYRLHARRVLTTSPIHPNQSALVFGGLCSSDHIGDSSVTFFSGYGSP